MQGRLLPTYNNFYQSHPCMLWKKEFPIAKKLELKHIEFIFDDNSPTHLNPLMNENGIKNIINFSKINRIKIENICADYFMKNPLYETGINFDQNFNTLLMLIKNSHKLGVKNIIIPCVDNSSLNSRKKIKNFLNFLEKFNYILEKYKVFLSLETDLMPKEFKSLINSTHSSWIKVNYDVGNSASLGFNIDEEFNAYGQFISSVHIKDRKLNGPSVFLGRGDVNFFKLLDNLKNIKYIGNFTMQVFRDKNGLSIFRKQLKTLKKILQKLLF